MSHRNPLSSPVLSYSLGSIAGNLMTHTKRKANRTMTAWHYLDVSSHIGVLERLRLILLDNL